MSVEKSSRNNTDPDRIESESMKPRKSKKGKTRFTTGRFIFSNWASFFKEKDGFTHIVRLIFSNWTSLIAIVSVISLLIGWFAYGISPLYTLEEIAYKQQQENIKRDTVNLHLKLGNSFLNVAQLDEAKIEFEAALKLDPLNSETQLGLFKSDTFKSIEQRDFDPEIMEKKLKMILQENPEDPHVFYFLGEIYRSIDSEQALKYYQTAIDKDPSIAAAYFGIGVIYDEQNKSDDALKMYEKAVNLSRWNQVFLDNLGDQYYQRKEYQKAIEQYELLLRLEGRFLVAYYTLSNAYRLTGNLEQARLDQERLIKLLGDANVTSMKRNQQAWFLRTRSNQVNFYDYPEKKFYAYYNIALTYYLRGNETEAIQYIKKANDLHIDKDLELEIKGLINFDIDNLQEEQSSFRNRTEEFKRKFL